MDLARNIECYSTLLICKKENFVDDRRNISNDGADLINIEFIDPSTKETSQITFDNRKSFSKVKKIMKKPFSALKIAKLTAYLTSNENMRDSQIIIYNFVLRDLFIENFGQSYKKVRRNLKRFSSSAFLIFSRPGNILLPDIPIQSNRSLSHRNRNFIAKTNILITGEGAHLLKIDEKHRHLKLHQNFTANFRTNDELDHL
uniref:Uncharacterized protein n=1 Tax=Romanomermis culicivorax TaxID=13658 RepID=A0A915JWW7_ROMCU